MLSPRLILAAVAGAIVGAATDWLVLRVSFSLLPLSNSAGPWVLLAFAIALTARGRTEAVVLSVLTLLALILGFYVYEATRGISVSHHQAAFWFLISFVAGPLLGLAADSLRRGGPLPAAVGAGLLGGILVGESVHGLREYDFLSPHDYWRVQIVVGVLVTVGPTLWRERRRPLAAVLPLAASLASCVTFGAVTLAVYELA